jgi:hypothetical protein
MAATQRYLFLRSKMKTNPNSFSDPKEELLFERIFEKADRQKFSIRQPRIHGRRQSDGFFFFS